MAFELRIETLSPAFNPGGDKDWPARSEIVRLLNAAAASVESGKDYGVLRDSNDDRVGAWQLEMLDYECTHCGTINSGTGQCIDCGADLK